MWYVIHLFVDLDKFLVRYQALPQSVQSVVRELITLKRPDKSMYQQDIGMFIGYAFAQIDPKFVQRVHNSLKAASLGEILSTPGSRYLMPLSAPDVEWVYTLLRSNESTLLQHGTAVRILDGPFEGMYGTVESVAGQTVTVRVPLRRSVSIAQCPVDSLVAA